MIKKNSKLWIICIGFALLVLCFSIGASSMFYVFAEVGTIEQTQVYEESEEGEYRDKLLEEMK